jgi:hypothetical protein
MQKVIRFSVAAKKKRHHHYVPQNVRYGWSDGGGSSAYSACSGE